MSKLTGYLSITLRKFYREKLYAFINLTGLSISIACCLILALYLESELSYDRHFSGHENIYRIVEEFNNKGQLDSFARTGASLGHLMKQDFDEVIDYVAFRPYPSLMLRHEDKGYFWDGVYMVTPNIFEVFKHEIIYGDPATAMEQEGSMAVSESFARRYFGEENPVGELVTSDLGEPNRITLVFADLPDNTHLHYDVLISGNLHKEAYLGNEFQQRQRLWQTPNYTYLVMHETFDPADFERMQAEFFARHMSVIAQLQNMSMRYWLEPLADIHLRSNLQRDEPGGNMAYIYAFTAVAVFIIAIACINYMNLATARSIKRSREVGMRKILGAGRGMLILQFVTEAILFSLIAMLLGIMLVEVLLTLTDIEALLGKSFDFRLTDNPRLFVSLIGFSVALGLTAGIYPAVYLSSWAPLSALVSNTAGSRSNVALRQLLVLVQFTISIAVVSGTLLMAKQMNFLSNLGLGFDRENKVLIRLTGADVIQNTGIIREELMRHRNILGVATHGGRLGSLENMGAIPIETRDGNIEAVTINVAQVDEEFFDVMDIEIVEGRTFNERMLTDVGRNFIVNETLVKHMGWDDPLGKIISDGRTNGRVIGVMRDIHFQSLHNVIDPLALTTFDDDFSTLSSPQRALMQRYMTVSISADGVRETLDFLRERFGEYSPKHPFEFEFLDQHLDRLYQSESNLMKLIGIFSAVCIVVACLGLLGLASYSTEQRSREISIRKVLGASTEQIIRLLSSNVLLLICVGGLVASLITWLAIDEWLSSFAYRTGIGMLAFVAAIFTALLVAYLTVALQAWKTARADPVEALRYE